MTIRLDQREEFALITIDRPDALNALNRALLGELVAALEAVDRGGARALLVTGAGTKSFCAGADIRELMGRTPAEHKSAMEYGQAVFARLDALHIPSVAVINGYAFGGGLELALACTFRLATPNAKMGLPEVKLGLIPGYGGTQRLPRVVGEARALELVMTGRTVDADEAQRTGLVNRLIDGDDPVGAAVAYAREFSGYSLPVLTCARSAVKRALDTPLAEGLKIEADLSAIVYQTRDCGEGMAAFAGKRKPRFEDR
jgi:enoyl-CoA hydratase